MKKDRKKYLEKLLASVMETAKGHRVIIDGEECIEQDWVDVELLCGVVAEDVLGYAIDDDMMRITYECPFWG